MENKNIRKDFKESLQPQSDHDFIDTLREKHGDYVVIIDNPETDTITLIPKETSELGFKPLPFVVQKHRKPNDALSTYKDREKIENYIHSYLTDFKYTIFANLTQLYPIILNMDPNIDADFYVREKNRISIQEKANKKIIINNKIAENVRKLEEKYGNKFHAVRPPKRDYQFSDDPDLKKKLDLVKLHSPYLKDIIASRIVFKEINGSKKESDLISACYYLVNKIQTLTEKEGDFKIYKTKDYIHSPKKNGYQSFHIIFKHNYIPDCFYEMQIRTEQMQIWSDYDHDTVYKKKELTPESPQSISIRSDIVATNFNPDFPDDDVDFDIRTIETPPNVTFEETYKISREDYEKEKGKLTRIIKDITQHYALDQPSPELSNSTKGNLSKEEVKEIE